MTTEQIIARVLEVLGVTWIDLAIAALTEKYGEQYSDPWIAGEPRLADPTFRVTPEYIMELIGVPQ